MAGSFTVVDLGNLPAPDVIETLSTEQIVTEMMADLVARYPEFTALVESDPAYKLVEVFAYRETLVRARVNSAAKAVMLAFAQNGDLDQLAANFNVQRRVITPGDDTTIPPTPPVMEGDTEFRARIPLSLEAYTTAGPEGSYVYFALGADGDVKDASAISPEPGYVDVYVLSRTGNGTPSSGLLAKVDAAVNAEEVRPLTDFVTIKAPSILNYSVTAILHLYPGPDSAVVVAAAIAALQEYTKSVQRIGFDVATSGIQRALHQTGVRYVELVGWSGNLSVDDDEASFCTAINVTAAPGTGS